MSRKALWLIAALSLVSFAGRGQVNLSSGLVAYYPFSGNFNDASGSGNNGTAMNGVTFGTDQWGNPNSAASFDGINDYVNVLPTQSLVAGKRFSVAFRFKTASSALQIPISKADFTPSPTFPDNVQYHVAFFAGATVGNNGLFLGTTHNGNNCSQNSGPPNVSNHRTFGATPNVNVWHCAVMTFDSGMKKLFIDGILTGQSTVTGFINNSEPDSCVGGALRLGCWWQGDPRWFSGLMDEVRIYNRTLNSTEVSALCSFNPFATVINSYAAVLSNDSCTNTFAVDDATGFSVGDSVLMIQMKGAVVDSSNTASFGNVLQIGSAGNYEYNAIQSVSANSIRLVNAVQRTYSIPTGKVQFVRVPHYTSYITSAPHTAAPWNGIKGGVFAISVAGVLTVDSSIDVSGKGFRGGVQNGVPPTVQNCSITTWSGPVSINLTAQKGEGIAEVSAPKMGGRGKLANGGGSGNAHNAGGGGGANAGAGGLGGSEFSGCAANPTPSVTQGIGGTAMAYSNATNKIFMGGGGGAGEVNNNAQASGGAGGGIIVIRAGNISSPNGGQLLANGQAAPECVIGTGVNTCNDGMGGGGGGGVVLVSTPAVAGALTTSAVGGKGANMSAASGSGQVGPGGGGGGGTTWFSGTATPAGVTAQNTGGGSGVINFNNSAWGATPGATGLTLTGLSIPIANVPFTSPCVNDTTNAYAAITAFDSCTNTFTVDDASKFFAGDTVLMIQMKGAIIDSSNTASFGNVVQLGNAGNYEYNAVQSVNGNNIRLVNAVQRSYTIPNGKVQFVRVPHHAAYTVNVPHSAMPWNGVKGGVFAINVAGPLTVNASIDVSGKGFRPGLTLNPTTHTQYILHQTDYCYPQNGFNGAQKGEGIAEVSAQKIFCRGPLFNGGGGANSTNSGGGGGGNGGTGGLGGNEWPGAVAPLPNGGIGGKVFTYLPAANKIFLGGGGGAGHINDGTFGHGGAGGGVVAIRAGSITGAGAIRAGGANAPDCANCIDGLGGGGGGGTVLINASASSSLTVNASGGKGATINNPIGGTHGPGGGGGGGALLANNAGILASVSSVLTGGVNGTAPSATGPIPYGAQPGAAGVTGSGFNMPVANLPFVSPCVNDTIINAYAAVTAFDSCTNTFTVDSTDNFFAGDTVILIQMKGVGFDSTNSPAFGTVLAYNNAGNYEYNVVQAKTANTITLRNVLLRTYTIPGGAVQLVKVPSFTNYTTNAPHTARAWNGVKGGVLALNVTNTLTLAHQMRASGKGFAGGEKMLLSVYGCNRSDYFYPPVTNEGAKKGEGPATLSVGKSCGRGALVSGGGGGNDHNSGGGGGSNGGGGGRGGFQHPLGGCVPLINDIGGRGGNLIVYSNSTNKIFLGGGGGAGHGNQASESAGGAGGGVVLVRAGVIVGSGGGISSHGAASPACAAPGAGCNDDGGGGGGGGGAILVRASAITGTISASANGGIGANTYSQPTQLFNMGPGGGGGGGTVWMSAATMPTNVAANVAGGLHGVQPQWGNDSFGAVSGSAGQILVGLQMPVSTVQFVAAPPVTIQDTTLSCRTVQFIATGGAGTPTWNFGNGASASGNPATYTYPSGGTFVASVQYPGCSGSDTETVTLPFDPVVTMTGNPSICAGASTPLTASGAASFAWTPSAGLNTSSGSTVTASPTATTTYTVTGTASTGCTDTAMHTLTVNPIPTVTATSVPNTICEGAIATLNASTAVPATFSWTPGGATQATTQVSPTTNTVYTVTATAAGCTATDTAQVFVLTKPQVTIATPTPAICPQATAVLNASVNLPGGSFVWAPPISGTGTSVTTPSLAASAAFAVVYTAPNGCKDTATQTISVNPAPVVAISGPALLCEGAGPASLTASGAATYSWSPAQHLNTTTGASVLASPPVGTSITYAITGTDAAGCTGIAQHTLVVEPSPTVRAGADTGYCSGGAVQLTASGATSYSWNPTNASASGASILVGGTAAITASTAYVVTGTTGTCSGADTVVVTARALPTVLALPKLARVCLYDSTTITAAGAASFSWTPAGGLANPSAAATRAKPVTTTTYTVVGTDAWGCVNQDTLRVAVGEALPVRASGDGVPISCDNSLAQLHVTGATRYVWSPGQYLNDSTMAHPVATPPQTMQFTVIGYNAQGCSGRDTITVVSLKESKLAMPNVFTPNGDGLNDRVFPLVQCDFHFKQWSVYNRWGQRLYQSSNAAEGWNGHFNGKPCDVGVYIFKVEGESDNGVPKMLTGNISLLK